MDDKELDKFECPACGGQLKVYPDETSNRMVVECSHCGHVV